MTATLTPPSAPPRPAAAPRRRPRWRPNLLGGLGAGAWLVVVGVPLYFLAVTSVRASACWIGNCSE